MIYHNDYNNIFLYTNHLYLNSLIIGQINYDVNTMFQSFVQSTKYISEETKHLWYFTVSVQYITQHPQREITISADCSVSKFSECICQMQPQAIDLG